MLCKCPVTPPVADPAARETAADLLIFPIDNLMSIEYGVKYLPYNKMFGNVTFVFKIMYVSKFLEL